MSDEASAYRELARCGGVADLSDRIKLVIRGADRVRYLNGQVTSNVAQLEPGRTQPACITTAKGKLCAEVVITALSDSLLVDADASLGDTLSARLERYIVADDVNVEQSPEGTCLLHFLGPEPPPLSTSEGFTLYPARRFGINGWDCWTDTAAASWDGSDFASRFLVLNEPLLESLRIERGIPRWGYELDENTLPPEAGLERTHIDYQKGCYIGQEVISRLKSVGHVNRQLVGFIAERDAPLTAPSGVFAVKQLEREIGQLTSTTWSFALERHIALGYLKRGAPTRDLVSRPVEGRAEEVSVTAQVLPFVR